MRVALLSDIHDHTTHLLLALQAAKEHGCTHLLFMGDMADITTFRTLREEWPYPMNLVFGNNEYDIQSFQQLALQWPHTTLHGYHGEPELDGRKLFLTHLPWDAVKAAASGQYDAVFFGHTHRAEAYYQQGTLLANPGDVCGRSGTPGIGVYDTETNRVCLISI